LRGNRHVAQSEDAVCVSENGDMTRAPVLYLPKTDISVRLSSTNTTRLRPLNGETRHHALTSNQGAVIDGDFASAYARLYD